LIGYAQIFAGYATQPTADGFLAPLAVVFDTSIEKVLRSLDALA